MESSGIQLRIGDMLFAIQKRFKLILTLTFVGLVMGLLLTAVSYVQSTMQNYEVTGSFAIATRPEAGTYLNGADAPGMNDFTLGETMVDAVMYLIQSDRVLDQVINEQQLLGVDVEDLRKKLSVRQYNATQIIEMTLNWSNDTEGLGIFNGMVAVTNRLLPEILQMGRLVMINNAAAETAGGGVMGKLVWLILAMLGFFTGIGYAVIEILMHPTLTNTKDVEPLLGLETMGMIPYNEAHFGREDTLLAEGVHAPEVIQGFSAAAYILRNRLGMREKHHCFYVTSTTHREGRSSVAANLAIQLSDMEHRTLLIDFDIRNPSLGAMFLEHVDYTNSLNALYRGDANEAEAITTLTGYLDLLPTVLEHNTISMDSTVISLIDRLCERYEYIILDAPPVGKESDALSLNQVANTVLFVVGYDMATIPDIQASLEKLDKSGIRVLGCMVNGVQNSWGREPVKKVSRSRKNTAVDEMADDLPKTGSARGMELLTAADGQPAADAPAQAEENAPVQESTANEQAAPAQESAPAQVRTPEEADEAVKGRALEDESPLEDEDMPESGTAPAEEMEPAQEMEREREIGPAQEREPEQEMEPEQGMEPGQESRPAGKDKKKRKGKNKRADKK